MLHVSPAWTSFIYIHIFYSQFKLRTLNSSSGCLWYIFWVVITYWLSSWWNFFLCFNFWFFHQGNRLSCYQNQVRKLANHPSSCDFFFLNFPPQILPSSHYHICYNKTLRGEIYLKELKWTWLAGPSTEKESLSIVYWFHYLVTILKAVHTKWRKLA